MERVKDRTLMRPIVYGNTAHYLGKKREEDGHTHEWTVFIKPYYNEDASKYIRKVQFKLHDSYANATRMIEKPPYEVTETGWGEFEIQIRIYFVDANEKPVTAFHYLRLFHPQVTLPNGRTMVAAEYYDEIVFQDPTMQMYKILTHLEARKAEPRRFHTDFSSVRQRTQDMINNARNEINKEIQDLMDSLKAAHELIGKYAKEVETLEAAAGNGEESGFIGENSGQTS